MTNRLVLSKFYCIWVYFYQQKLFPTLKSFQTPGFAFETKLPVLKGNWGKNIKIIGSFCKIFLAHCDFLRDIFSSLWFFVRYLYLIRILSEILISHQDSSIYIYIAQGFFVRCLLFIYHQDSSWDTHTSWRFPERYFYSNADVTVIH